MKLTAAQSGLLITHPYDVEFQTIDGAECACVTASYFVRDDEGYSKTAQEYILRKDQEGKWKILAFQEGVVKEDE